MPRPPHGLLAAALLALPPAAAAQQPLRVVEWHDVAGLTLEGRGWADTAAPFDRLPARAEGSVRAPVWRLSRHSAGIVARFTTDATVLFARWKVTSKRLARPHMAATAVSGLDLYARPPGGGSWRWLATAQPAVRPADPEPEDGGPAFETTLVAGLEPGEREYMLYLPLYNGVRSAAVGVPEGSALAPSPPRRAKPLVFYGTSITQGACASRPGMAHTAILGRRLDRPVINLGFSGNGTMEPSVTVLLAELDPAVYVIDCLPNMTAALVGQRVGPLVMTLRRARPATPILLVEDRSYADGAWLERQRARNADSRRALRREYERLRAAGVPHLHYLAGEGLLGDDGEATVDGSHPTDLGFARQADAFETALAPLLRK